MEKVNFADKEKSFQFSPPLFYTELNLLVCISTCVHLRNLLTSTPLCICAITGNLSYSGFGDRRLGFSYLPISPCPLRHLPSIQTSCYAMGLTCEVLVLHSVFSLLTHLITFGWLICGVREKIFTIHLLKMLSEILLSYCSRGERLQYRTELSSEYRKGSYSSLLTFDQTPNPDYFVS